jgi:hypothetical protein
VLAALPEEDPPPTNEIIGEGNRVDILIP